MKLNRKEVPRNSLRDDDVTNLADLCRKFEGLNLRIPILSVFEGKETKIRDNLLHSIRGSGTRKQIVSACMSWWRHISMLTYFL